MAIEEAPIPSSRGTSSPARRAYFDRYVESLKPGVVGRIRLSETNTSHSIGRSVHEAAKRVKRRVVTWTDGRFYYVNLDRREYEGGED